MDFFNQVIVEYSRKHENEVEQDLKDSKTEQSSQISGLIQKTLNDGNKVWLCTDWHLWMFDKKTRTVSKRSDFNAILNAYNRTVSPADLVIYMGDLADGECEKKKELAKVLNTLPGTKILVRGNNDLFDDQYYLSNGFKYVTPKFVYQNMLFSHMPAKNNNRINIHGHLHNYKTYWMPFTNQIDVAYLGARKKPVELNEVIKAQPEYSKQIKEVPEKFDENIKQECCIDPFDD